MSAIERWDRWVYWRLAVDFCGNPNPPGDHLGIDIGEDGEVTPERERRCEDALYVVRTNNDGFELWIGYPDKWLFHCRAAEARRIAWFILWTWWARGTWFGLKRWIWYASLKRRVERSQRRMAQIRNAA